MRSYLRIQSPWAQLGLFFGLLIVALVLTSFIGAIILLAKGLTVTDIKSLNFNDPRTVDILKLIQSVSTITMFFLPAAFFAFISFRNKPFYFLGFHKPSKNNFYIIAVLIMIVSFPFAGWLGILNQHIPLARWMIDMEKDAGKQMTAFLKLRSNTDLYINLFIVALLPAICEEVCFRGALQRIMIDIFKRPWIGIIATAIFFSAFHMQFEGFLPRMFLGILLGSLFWYSGSLWPNIVAHFFYNGIQVIIVLYYPKFVDENPSVPIYLAAISGLLVWGLMIFMRKQSAATFSKVYEMEEVTI